MALSARDSQVARNMRDVIPPIRWQPHRDNRFGRVDRRWKSSTFGDVPDHLYSRHVTGALVTGAERFIACSQNDPRRCCRHSAHPQRLDHLFYRQDGRRCTCGRC